MFSFKEAAKIVTIMDTDERRPLHLWALTRPFEKARLRNSSGWRDALSGRAFFMHESDNNLHRTNIIT